MMRLHNPDSLFKKVIEECTNTFFKPFTLHLGTWSPLPEGKNDVHHNVIKMSVHC